MGILVVAGVLFGIILGRFFKWYILGPASAVGGLVVLANPAQMDNLILGWFVQFIVLTTSLQIGFLVGLFTQNLPHAPQRSEFVDHLDEGPAKRNQGGNQGGESGRRAA